MQLLASGWITEWSTAASIDRQPLATFPVLLCNLSFSLCYHDKGT